MFRPWAFWRRLQYAFGVSIFLVGVVGLLYVLLWHQTPTCFDGKQNGDERGIDCGGVCDRICAFDTSEPTVLWTQAFRVTDGMYNAVAYVENRNISVGSREVHYTFTLHDPNGVVVGEKRGTTFLPPESIYPIFEGRISVNTKEVGAVFLEIDPVHNWERAVYDREQFVVESRVLKNVDSTPRLNAVVYNSGLTEESDVEVVATIFDIRGNALTASRSVVPRFGSRESVSVVFTWPEAIAKTLRSCEVPSDVVVAIDLSGSMNDDGGSPPEPVSSVLTAANAFVERLEAHDQVGVVTFATDAKRVEGLTNERTRVGNEITKLSIDPKSETGRTNIGDAIKLAREEFDSVRHNSNARKVLVLLTDGRANAPGADAEKYAVGEAIRAREAGIDVYTIGLGNAVNEVFLSEVASLSNQSFIAPNVSNLNTIYRNISTAICEDGPAVIEIIPKVRGDLKDVF